MRRTRHRRRFQTDRVVAKRRRRLAHEDPTLANHRDTKAFSHGYLDSADPWDCGNPRCGMCHWDKCFVARRARENRQWRRDWDL
ncbi:MAG TPA: hypothetical protein VNS09_16115 [Solirubrobacter sp.]|nr:hypothetical protein [Solirubrobacter sp.]